MSSQQSAGLASYIDRELATASLMSSGLKLRPFRKNPGGSFWLLLFESNEGRCQFAIYPPRILLPRCSFFGDQDESLSLRSSGIFFGFPSPPMTTCTVRPVQSSSPLGSLQTSYSSRMLDLPIFPTRIFTSTSSSYLAGAL